MLSSRRNSRTTGGAPLGRPGARGAQAPGLRRPATPTARGGGSHPLVRGAENASLFDYEQRVKAAFDAIVPVLKRVSGLQHEEDFERQAQHMARQQLGFELPAAILADAWVDQLDMRRLYAWCVFETYQRFVDDFFSQEPLASSDEEGFGQRLQEMGFHIMDISPCADGRLAHVIRYVLRLPYRAVRRKSYAGALFDIEDSLSKWTETELTRFREGKPNTADAPTRYLKLVVYHFSSVDPTHEGCAAHGSDTMRAAEAGRERLLGFKQAVESSFCCGASIDLLLVGLDTDTDAIRVHLPNGDGEIDVTNHIDALELYEQTRGMNAGQAEAAIADAVAAGSAGAAEGIQGLASWLIANNMSQIEYVKQYHGSHYSDIGHAERFIGAGIGFEEIQLRNLTYFAYMDTVEEAAPDLDVGVKIFTGLNVSHGLPIPVVVRYDYHGNVPGARERAIAHGRRVTEALRARYAELDEKGLLHTLQLVRDCTSRGPLEVVDSSANGQPQQEAH
ncbi:MAG: carboxysome shell carbonic anhydrase [Gammaproteobacteria bacterium]|nr:carboxysome shell carbonic anhydrase [Gammaproteobacteria bacterium]